jgi:hypothetical protein
MIARIILGVAAFAVVASVGLAVNGAQAPAPAQGPGPDGGAAELSSKVKIVIQTIPPEKAKVSWGKKPIGLIKGKNKPLILERPRDSGPMDVVIRADGYVPVHTRAYTFTDFKLYVKLTPLEEKKSLFGYREALPDAGAPEAGPPPPTMAMPGDAGAPPR